MCEMRLQFGEEGIYSMEDISSHGSLHEAKLFFRNQHSLCHAQDTLKSIDGVSLTDCKQFCKNRVHEPASPLGSCEEEFIDVEALDESIVSSNVTAEDISSSRLVEEHRIPSQKLNMSQNELNMSTNELDMSQNELETSQNELETSQNELEMSQNERGLPVMNPVLSAPAADSKQYSSSIEADDLASLLYQFEAVAAEPRVQYPNRPGAQILQNAAAVIPWDVPCLSLLNRDSNALSYEGTQPFYPVFEDHNYCGHFPLALTYKRTNFSGNAVCETARKSFQVLSEFSPGTERKAVRRLWNRKRSVSRSQRCYSKSCDSYPCRVIHSKDLHNSITAQPRVNSTSVGESVGNDCLLIQMTDQERAMAERRVVYVGGLPADFTALKLQRLFESFGSLESVAIHCREAGESYGFLTYTSQHDACTAIEKGSHLEGAKFTLCFGGRRMFCETEYADLDGCLAVREEWAPSLRTKRSRSDEFDRLLKKSIKTMHKH